MVDTLVGLLVLFPFIGGLVCLKIRNYKIRAGIVITIALVLIVDSLLFLARVALPVEYSPMYVVSESGTIEPSKIVDTLTALPLVPGGPIIVPSCC
jgi:hypothetical protein